MFNNKHLDKVLGEIKSFHKKSIFCYSKNRLCYRLSKMNSQCRGAAIERMIRNYYRELGKKVLYLGGNASFDMIVDGYRIEVKSALARLDGNKYSYKFQHICPNNFHKLVLVFISPEGISARSLDSRTVAKYLGSKYSHKNLHVGKRILGRVLAA